MCNIFIGHTVFRCKCEFMPSCLMGGFLDCWNNNAIAYLPSHTSGVPLDRHRELSWFLWKSTVVPLCTRLSVCSGKEPWTLPPCSDNNWTSALLAPPGGIRKAYSKDRSFTFLTSFVFVCFLCLQNNWIWYDEKHFTFIVIVFFPYICKILFWLLLPSHHDQV